MHAYRQRNAKICSHIARRSVDRVAEESWMAGTPTPSWGLWVAFVACFFDLGNVQTSGGTELYVKRFKPPWLRINCSAYVRDSSSILGVIHWSLLRRRLPCSLTSTDSILPLELWRAACPMSCAWMSILWTWHVEEMEDRPCRCAERLWCSCSGRRPRRLQSPHECEGYNRQLGSLPAALPGLWVA